MSAGELGVDLSAFTMEGLDNLLAAVAVERRGRDHDDARHIRQLRAEALTDAAHPDLYPAQSSTAPKPTCKNCPHHFDCFARISGSRTCEVGDAIVGGPQKIADLPRHAEGQGHCPGCGWMEGHADRCPMSGERRAPIAKDPMQIEALPDLVVNKFKIGNHDAQADGLEPWRDAHAFLHEEHATLGGVREHLARTVRQLMERKRPAHARRQPYGGYGQILAALEKLQEVQGLLLEAAVGFAA